MISMATVWIYSISSDIGTALALRRLNSGWNVAGTYRTWSKQLQDLKEKGVNLVQMDAADPDSVAAAAGCLVASVGRFDECVIALGTLEPIGHFHETSWHEWDANKNNEGSDSGGKPPAVGDRRGRAARCA